MDSSTMPPAGADAAARENRKRRGNMKKKNRSERNRLKREREIIRAAEEAGEDPSKALKAAGFDAAAGRKVQNQQRERGEPSQKALERIERLKMKKQKRHIRVQEEESFKDDDEYAACSPEEMQADLLWQGYAKAFGYAEQVRQSSRLGSTSFYVPKNIERNVQIHASMESLEHILLNAPASSSRGSWNELLASQPQEHGCPAALFVSPSAIGALDMAKACPKLQKGCKIAKLFAKHIKVSEQQSYLDKHPICIACGTPNRLLTLSASCHIQYSRLLWIVLDMRPNPKKQTLLDIPEIAADFWKLWDTFLKSRISANLGPEQQHRMDSHGSRSEGHPDDEFPKILLIFS
eukprot:jgi/Picsp_1/251/NSC_00250-R1_atp-dependent rna helicase ddx1